MDNEKLNFKKKLTLLLDSIGSSLALRSCDKGEHLGETFAITSDRQAFSLASKFLTASQLKAYGGGTKDRFTLSRKQVEKMYNALLDYENTFKCSANIKLQYLTD